MIPTPNQVWLVVEPIDMRAGIDGLSQRIQNTLGCSPCDGSAYAFRNRRLTRLKLLVWDGTGVWLCQRRLHRGRFTWPTSNATTVTLTPGQWAWLTAGVDWQRLSATPNAHWLRIPAQAGQRFQPKLDSNSKASWTLIPAQPGQPIVIT